MTLKVLIVTPIFPPEIGGPATYTKELLERLPPEVGVKVISFGANSSRDYEVTIISVAGGIVLRQARLFFQCLTQGAKADIFYLQEPAVVGFVGLVAGKLLGKEVITKYVGDPEWEETRRGGKPGGWLARVTGFVLKNSDKVIVPASHLVDWLVGMYGLSKERITVIPNSVELGVERKKMPGQIVFVGRLVPWKNVDLIIESVKELQNRDIKCHLVIIGDGPMKESLEKRAESTGLGTTISFKGRLLPEEIQEELAKSEILVLYSDYEGLSHAVLEAMASRTVVVASDIPGNREILGESETGVLVEPKKVTALSTAIKIILVNRKLREKYQQNGLKLVKERYSWEANLPKLIKVFYELAEK